MGSDLNYYSFPFFIIPIIVLYNTNYMAGNYLIILDVQFLKTVF